MQTTSGYRRIIEALGARVETIKDTSATAKCPSHEDSTASLSVKQGNDGRVLVHCFAGCTAQQIVGALGMSLGDLFAADQRRGRIKVIRTREYGIAWPSGEVVAIHVRRDLEGGEKKMSWRRPTGEWNLGGMKVRDLPLYAYENLPKWIGQPIIITEGEAAAQALIDLGVSALGTVTGAGESKSPSAEVLKHLAGQDVILWSDHDDVGREHMNLVARGLAGVAARVRWIAWGTEKGDDAADFVKRGGTREQLADIIAGAVDYVPQDPGPAEECERRRRSEVLVAGVHSRLEHGRKTTLQVSERDFASAVLAALPTGTLYRRGEYVGEIFATEDERAAPVFRKVSAERGIIVVSEHVSLWISMVTTEESKAKRSPDNPAELIPLEQGEKGETKYTESKKYVHYTKFLSTLILAEGISSRYVRELDGIVSAPVLRPDGSILDRPGYDPASRLYLAPSGQLLTIPPRPSRDDAVAALAALLEVVCDVPFVSDTARSAWLAALLAIVGRPAIDGCVPGLLVDASIRGSGKGLLSDTIAIIATGRVAPKSPYTSKEEEVRKHLLGIALSGEIMFVIDNVPNGGTLMSAALDAFMTAEVYSDRVLATHDSPKMANRTLVVATGNNVALGGDAPRRFLRCRIDPQCAAPQDRTGFRHSPLLAWVRAERPRLLGAALVVLRAYILAGRPAHGRPELGSFERWSALIRGALIWLGRADPVEALVARESDADSEAVPHAALIHAWARLTAPPGQEGLTIAEALKLDGDAGQLRAALDELIPPRKGERAGNVAIGHKFKSLNGKWRAMPAGGEGVIRRSETLDHDGKVRWIAVVRLPTDPRSAGDRGIAGDVSALSARTCAGPGPGALRAHEVRRKDPPQSPVPPLLTNDDDGPAPGRERTRIA